MRHADAERDLYGYSVDDQGYLVDTRAQPFGQAHRTLVSSFAEHTNKFLTPVARKQISRAQVPLALGSDRFEYFVPCMMSILIVDLFKVIDVEHQDGQGAFVSLRTDPFCFCQFVEIAPVRDAGQCIGSCEVFELAFGGLAHSDIEQDKHIPNLAPLVSRIKERCRE